MRVVHRLPLFAGGRKCFAGGGEAGQFDRAVHDDGGDHVAEYGRLAGAGRPVDGEQPGGVAERPQDLVHRELLAEGKRPIGARDPPARGNTIRSAACADAQRFLLHVGAGDAGAGGQVLAERSTSVFTIQRRADEQQVVDDIAVEERLPLRRLVGTRDADLVAVDADVLGMQFLGHAESVGEFGGETEEIAPVSGA